MQFIKEYFPTIFKTLLFIVFCVAIIFGIIFGGTQVSKYFATQAIMDELLISKNKINKLSTSQITYKPSSFELETEDGLYIIHSNNFFKTIDNISTLTGEDFEVRKKVIEKLEEHEIKNVKRGSLKFLGKNEYEAFDFETKHYFTINVDHKNGKITISDKEII